MRRWAVSALGAFIVAGLAVPAFAQPAPAPTPGADMGKVGAQLGESPPATPGPTPTPTTTLPNGVVIVGPTTAPSQVIYPPDALRSKLQGKNNCTDGTLVMRLLCKVLPDPPAYMGTPRKLADGSLVVDFNQQQKSGLEEMLDQGARLFAGWASERISKLYADVRANTSPELGADWFVEFYNKTFFIGVLLLAAVVFAGMLWGIGRGSGASVAEALMGGVLALGAMYAAPVALKVAVETIDWISKGILALTGANAQELLEKLQGALDSTAMSGVMAGVNVLAGLAVAILAAIGAFMVWLTMTMREQLIYAATVTGVLIYLLWATPARKWVKHLASFQGILLFMPIPIAVAIGLAVHALGAIGTPAIGTDETVAATASLALAGVAPWKLFKYLPFLGMMAMQRLNPGDNVASRAMAGARYTRDKVRSWVSSPTAKGETPGPVIAGAATSRGERPPQQNWTVNVLNILGGRPGGPRVPDYTVSDGVHYNPPGPKREPVGAGQGRLIEGSKGNGNQDRPIQPN